MMSLPSPPVPSARRPRGLGRWLPGSLFARLALLLIGVVLASQLLVRPLLLGLHAWVLDGDPLQGAAAGLLWRPHGHGWTELALVLLGLLLAAWVGARCCARPVERLVHAARALDLGLERPPLPEDGSVEFREASRVFNQLQASVRQRLEERDRVVAAVSHDLRTPLTRLRLRAEHLQDAADRCLFRRDIAEMEQMISVTLDHLRGVAAAESAVWTDIHALVQSLADDQLVGGHGVPVRGQAGALRVQPQALRRCLANLLGNAIRYGQCAEIVLADDGAEVLIEVRDQGPGLPEAELDRVLQPFYRLPGAVQQHAGGAGLGLSIARDIVRRHGGELQLLNRPGGGLRARVRLPRQPAGGPGVAQGLG